MKEIEVKIYAIDLEEVVAKLEEIGAKKLESGLVRITSFDFPDNRLRNDDSYVRVRTFGHRTELVLKKKISKGKYKIAEETETTVGDYETTLTLLEKLGMVPFAQQEKYRASYTLDGIRFELDKYPLVPWYAEVEAPTEEKVERGVQLLGFDMSQTSSQGGGDVIRSHGLTDQFFTFKEKGELPDYDKLFV